MKKENEIYTRLRTLQENKKSNQNPEGNKVIRFAIHELKWVLGLE